MSYPQQYPPQGYPAAQQPMPQQAYADPNAAQQYPPQGYAQQPPAPQFPAQQAYQAPPAVQQINPYAQQQGYPAAPQAQAYQPMAQIPTSPDVEDTSDMFGGAASISWDVAKGYVLGTPRGGQILAKKVTQQTDITTKMPKFFQGSNQPMMQIVVTLQTRERTDAQDDGKRTMYIKGLMMKSAKTAFEAKGAKDLEIGGWFYAANTSKTGGKQGNSNLFECVYARPGEADPLGHLPPYVAPQLAAPAQPQQPQFVPPQQPNYPVPGQAPAFNPYAQQGAPQAPAAQGIPQSYPGQQPQGNPYGQGFNPPESPGGQAYAAAQQPAQGQPQATFAGQPIDPTAGFAQNPPAGGQAGPPAGYNPFGG